MNEKMRILLADDDTEFCARMSAVLDSADDFEDVYKRQGYRKKNRNCRSGESLSVYLRCTLDGVHNCLCLVCAFHILVIRHGIRNDAAARLHGHDAVLLGSHADGDAGIHIAGKIQIAECAAVYAARLALLLLDDLARADLCLLYTSVSTKALMPNLSQMPI